MTGDTRAHQQQERQEALSAWFDVALSVLALVMLGLFVVQFTAALEPAAARRVEQAQLAIWAIFLIAFLIELALAPAKGRYLREHWLTALSVAVPVLRVFRAARGLRVLRTMRAVRGVRLAGLLTSLTRSTRALGTFLRRGHIGYLALLTGLVVVASAAGAYYLERDAEAASVRTLGDALWWAATIVTTVNSPLETVTAEGRLLALLLRIYGVAVIGYLTGTIAAYLLGRPGSPMRAPQNDELQDLRLQLGRLEDTLRRIERSLHSE